MHEIIINANEAINLKEIQEGIVGGFGHRKWKRKMLQFYCQKIKTKKERKMAMKAYQKH